MWKQQQFQLQQSGAQSHGNEVKYPFRGREPDGQGAIPGSYVETAPRSPGGTRWSKARSIAEQVEHLKTPKSRRSELLILLLVVSLFCVLSIQRESSSLDVMRRNMTTMDKLPSLRQYINNDMANNDRGLVAELVTRHQKLKGKKTQKVKPTEEYPRLSHEDATITVTIEEDSESNDQDESNNNENSKEQSLPLAQLVYPAGTIVSTYENERWWDGIIVNYDDDARVYTIEWKTSQEYVLTNIEAGHQLDLMVKDAVGDDDAPPEGYTQKEEEEDEDNDTKSSSKDDNGEENSNTSQDEKEEEQTGEEENGESLSSNDNQLQEEQEYQYQDDGRLINDQTLDWDASMERNWLKLDPPYLKYEVGEKLGKERPPYMLLLTNVGWNHPNQTLGKTFHRSLREREIVQAVVDHPYFHPTAYQDILDGTLSIEEDIRYYVFSDVMTCKEYNYPHYGDGFPANLDGARGRSKDNPSNQDYVRLDRCWKKDQYGILEHPLFQPPKKNSNSSDNSKDESNGNSNEGEGKKKPPGKLIIFNCLGGGPWCNGPEWDTPVSIIAMGGRYALYEHEGGKTNYYMDPDRDQGLIPPAVNPAMLTPEQEESILSCSNEKERPLQVVYTGAFRDSYNNEFHLKHFGKEDVGTRSVYKRFHDPSKGRVITQHNDIPQSIEVQAVTPSGNTNDEILTTTLTNLTYHGLLKSSIFALVPRGDDKFSYRFTEALSAGAIPVYHGDDHMLPFRPEVVDWNKCAVLKPEREAGLVTLEYLELLAKNPTKLCQMRKHCYFEIYKQYVDTASKQLNGWIAGFEAMHRNAPKPSVGYICTQEEVDNLDCDPE